MYLRYAVTAYGLFRKILPGYAAINVFVVARSCHAGMCGIRYGYRIFIAYLNVPPFIAALAMMEIVYGIGLIVTNATPLGGYVEQYTNVSNGKFLGINYLIWIAIIVAAITWFISLTPSRQVYAIGGNPQAAEVAGVPVSNSDLKIQESSSCMVLQVSCSVRAAVHPSGPDMVVTRWKQSYDWLCIW